jgi:hypothetical protein
MEALQEPAADDREIMTYMSWAADAFWQPSQIAPGLGLSAIVVRSRLRALEAVGYVERATEAVGAETQFRLTARWQDLLESPA